MATVTKDKPAEKKEDEKAVESRWSPEEQQQIRDYMKHLYWSAAGAGLFLAVVFYLVGEEYIHLAGPTRTIDLPDFTSRFKFLLRFQTLNLVWLLFATYYVMAKRCGTPAVVASSGYDNLAETARNHLTNTVEQYLLSLLSQLVLITYLDAHSIVKYVPAINLVFFVGRLTYFYGYPKKREFGFQVNQFVLLATVVYDVYKFLQVYKLF